MTKTDTSREAGLTELEQIANNEARHAHRELIQRLTARAERAEADVDLIEQCIRDVLDEGGTFRDAAQYVALAIRAMPYPRDSQ